MLKTGENHIRNKHTGVNRSGHNKEQQQRWGNSKQEEGCQPKYVMNEH